MGKRKGKRKKPAMKRSCLDFRAGLDDLQDLARDHEIDVEYRVVQCGGRKQTYHVMFNQIGERVLNYWPGSGRAWSPVTGKRLTCGDAFAALDAAAHIASYHLVRSL